MNIDIQVRPIGGDPLVNDYVAGKPAIARFFAGLPFDPSAYRAKAREVEGRFDAEARRAMAAAVRPLSDRAAERLGAIAEGNGYFVTTGQQPGLFGGPLYTIHKALTAQALAARLEALLDVPVLALFWIASDDHDWDEANHVHVLDTGNVLRRLTLDGSPVPHRSMGRRRLDDGAESALGELAESIPPSDFAPSVLDRLNAAYRPESTVAEAFAKTMAGLFEGADLGLVDAQDPVTRGLAAPVIRKELERATIHQEALAASSQALETAGYTTQVAIQPGASNVFHEDDEHGRERLLIEGGEWVLRSSGRRLTEDALWSLWQDDPQRFSANVVLRPVVESAVFPTLAYVGGPGEVRYLAQTRGLFEAHGVGMPLVFPRFSVTLVEAKVKKVLDRFGLAVTAFHRPVHELIADVVRGDIPEGVHSAIAGLRESLQSGYGALNEAAREIDPTLKGPIFQARNEGFRALSDVEKKIRQHLKLRQETELEQLEKAAVNLAPMARPQERVLNVHQYLARYGDGLLDTIYEKIQAEMEARVQIEPTGAGMTS